MTHIKLQILKLIHNFVLNAWLIIHFLELHHTCEIGLYILERVTQLAHPSALLCQSCRSYMLALEMISVQLQDRRYRFHLSFDSFNDI
jgi:hypothetical protein